MTLRCIDAGGNVAKHRVFRDRHRESKVKRQSREVQKEKLPLVCNSYTGTSKIECKETGLCIATREYTSPFVELNKAL